jgi:hypothetical protein
MKINWRVLIASVLIVGALYWMVNSVRPHSYTGANLSFDIGTGTVTVTNPSDAPVPAQLVGAGTRTFTISSTIEGLSGTSTKQQVPGQNITQLFEFSSPPGVSEFTIVRGKDVKFVTESDTRLGATVQPISESESRTTLITGVVFILAALYYISRATGHSWISRLRGKTIEAPVQAAGPSTTSRGAANRGRDGRAYSE